MKMTFKAFAKKLFGVNLERLKRTFFIYLIVFWGLYIADFRIEIAPVILYLMAVSFTAGVMRQALSSPDNAAYVRHMLMLPFDCRQFVLPYIAALGAYTLLTKTAALLMLLLAVSDQAPAAILGSILCSVNAVLMAAAIYSFRKYWYAGGFWAASLIAAILFLGNSPMFLPLLIVNGVLAAMVLQRADGYSFCPSDAGNSRAVKRRKRHSVWRYLLRYLLSHKNYLLNTVVMWGAACVLPVFFKQMESQFMVPIGFAILSMNTPVCILLSCDPSFEQAVRFLPDQKRAFCIPYCLFIFACNMTANMIFLFSLQMHNGNVTVFMTAAALFFALLSAVCSVLLEWFYPIRDWKIESDLWHHPRKYIFPAIMLLLAGLLFA